MFKVGDMVRVKRDLLEDGDDDYLDLITWDASGYTVGKVLQVYNPHQEDWNKGGYDIAIRMYGVGMDTRWGCHMRAVFPNVLDKSSISAMLVKQYEI